MEPWKCVLIVLLVLAALIVIACGYVKAPPDRAYIISGWKKNPKVLIADYSARLKPAE